MCREVDFRISILSATEVGQVSTGASCVRTLFLEVRGEPWRGHLVSRVGEADCAKSDARLDLDKIRSRHFSKAPARHLSAGKHVSSVIECLRR